MINFTTSPGNIFPRVGKLGLLVKQLGSYQQSQLANQTDTTNGAVAQFNSESDIQAILGSSYLGNLSSPESIGGTAQQVCVATFNRVVFRDNPQPGQTLTNGNVNENIAEVIRQMKAEGATILAQTVTATPSAFTGYGNGAIVASVRRPFDGLMLENMFAESVQLNCIADSYSGGASPGNELFSVNGDGAQNDLFAFNWPLGSGQSAQLQAIDGDVSNSSGNLLANSGFADWSGSVPDNFTLVVGTNTAKETGITFTGGASLELIGDGATLTQLTQEFGDAATGSGDTLTQQTQYSFNLWMRSGAVSPAAGTLVADLVDQNGTVLTDYAGTPNSISFDLTTLNTVFTPFNGAFRTPVVMPTTTLLRLRLTVPLTNGANAYLDKMSLGVMTQLYASGPYFAVHSGSTNFVQGDYGGCATTNSRGAGGTLSTFQTLLLRLMPTVLTSEFLFPSSSVPSVPDSLIN